jgi:hypothetical protein
MEPECFYCDEGAEFIYIIQITIPGHVALHIKCQISINCRYEECYHLGYAAVQSIVTSFDAAILLCSFDPDNGGDIFLQNVG